MGGASRCYKTRESWEAHRQGWGDCSTSNLSDEPLTHGVVVEGDDLGGGIRSLLCIFGLLCASETFVLITAGLAKALPRVPYARLVASRGL